MRWRSLIEPEPAYHCARRSLDGRVCQKNRGVRDPDVLGTRGAQIIELARRGGSAIAEFPFVEVEKLAILRSSGFERPLGRGVGQLELAYELAGLAGRGNTHARDQLRLPR
jgi:hypothetical protein